MKLSDYLGKYIYRDFPVDPPTDLDLARARRAGASWPVGETMWLEVVAVDSDRLVGRLDNYPVFTSAVAYGDLVTFDPADIIAVREAPAA